MVRAFLPVRSTRSAVRTSPPSSTGADSTGRARSASPVTHTRYSFSTPWEGWVSRWVNAPSSVRRSRPSESMSSRPTGHTRAGQSATSSATVFRPLSSDRVDT